MVIVDVDGVQYAPLLDVHLSVYVPNVNPLMVDVGLLTLENVGELGPLTIDHKPVPVVIALPANVVLVASQSVWFEPATAVVGVSSKV